MARSRKRTGDIAPLNCAPSTSKEIELIELGVPEPCDANLLDIARINWQYSDWNSLVELNIKTLQNHPDRAKLALLAAVGHQQLGDFQQAKIFSRLSLDWGCNKKLVSKTLIAGVHITLGRAAAATGHVSCLLKHFEASITNTTPGISGKTLRLHIQQRIGQEFTQMGLPPSLKLKYIRHIRVGGCKGKHSVKDKDPFIVNDKSFISKLLQDKNFIENLKHPRMLKSILPKPLENLSINTIRYFISQKNKMLRTRDYAQYCEYSLPTFLVSFPRSGSNFVQSVLNASTGLCCCSFYAPRPQDPQCVFSYKSHALSPIYLNDEISRYYQEMKPPGKIIILKRDPRDVMISFYEFVKATKGIMVSQENFLDGIDYDYAFLANSHNVHSHLRKTDFTPLNIANAYIRHIKSWFISKECSADVLIISYEGLVETPAVYFNKIFTFLGLKATLNTDALVNKVSQYSSESRKRGIAYGWKSNNTHNTLIEKVNERFSKYINKLGY